MSPESDDPSETVGYPYKEKEADAQSRLEERKLKEATMGKEFLERLEKLSVPLVPLEDAAQKGK